MTITLIQPHNEDGKRTPMCAFDPENGYIGHDFKNMALEYTPPLIVCTRCGVRWTVAE